MARPKWEDDEFAPGGPDPEKIPCRDCFHRKEDTKLAKGCTYGICKAYPNGKPQEVLLKYESCPYYLNENDD